MADDDQNTYRRFRNEQLILRDALAMDRTALANERTLLAYVRTALALILAGATFVYLSQALWFAVFGGVCVLAGLVVLVIGAYRFLRVRRALMAANRMSDGG
jgi:putative membrane protein